MLAMLTVITALTYLDRMNLGIVGHQIQDEFGFGTETMGWILSGFVLGYALFQVPGGWAGDRYGPRSVLTLAIIWWSAFTALTALTPRLPLRNWVGLAAAFFAVRFLIGVGEACALPNANKMVSLWMGRGGRGVGNSLFLMGVGIGGACTPRLISWLMERWGWRVSLYLCAALGVFVAVGWHLYATSRPEQHPRVNPAELDLIRSSAGESAPSPTAGKRPPWGKLLSSKSSWALILSYSCEGYPNYIFYTWFFLYLVRVRGLSVEQGGYWGAAPFVAIILMAPLGGWLSDRAVATFGRKRGRQSIVWIGMTCSAILLSIGAHTKDNTLAILLLASAMGFNMFATPTWWATCTDLAPNYSASLSAMMNTSGNLGGWISPILTAYIATHFGWTRALDFAALLTGCAGALWFMVDATRSIEEAPARDAQLSRAPLGT